MDFLSFQQFLILVLVRLPQFQTLPRQFSRNNLSSGCWMLDKSLFCQRIRVGGEWHRYLSELDASTDSNSSGQRRKLSFHRTLPLSKRLAAIQ